MKTSPSSRDSDTRRYVLAFLLTALVYIAAGYGAYRFFTETFAVNLTSSRATVTTLAISRFVSPLHAAATPSERHTQPPLKESPPTSKSYPDPPTKTVLPPEAEPSSVQLPEPDTQPVTKPVEMPVPTVVKRHVTSAPKPRPKPKPAKRSVKRRIDKPVRHEDKTKRAEPRQKRIAGGSRHKASAAKKRRFLARLRMRIERAKRYPTLAKRRGLQGSVRVELVIAEDGTLQRIRLSGSKLFFASAKRAVTQAFPLSTRDAGVRFPLEVVFTLRYRLH